MFWKVRSLILQFYMANKQLAQRTHGRAALFARYYKHDPMLVKPQLDLVYKAGMERWRQIMKRLNQHARDKGAVLFVVL